MIDTFLGEYVRGCFVMCVFFEGVWVFLCFSVFLVVFFFCCFK